MDVELELQIDTYVDKDKRHKVKAEVERLDRKGYLITSVDNLAIRGFDRNMNRFSVPLCLIE